MRIDVICLTKTADDSYFEMCLHTLRTLLGTEGGYFFDVVLVESMPEPVRGYRDLFDEFPGHSLTVLCPRQEFNYNRFLNIGLSSSKGNDWILVINNDLSFDRVWLSEIMLVHESRPDLRAFSPFEPDYHVRWYHDFDSDYLEGYTRGFHVSGWCLLMHRTVMAAMGRWDERFVYWCQDDDYAEFLRTSLIGNALVRKSIVRHLVESSVSLIPDSEREAHTGGMVSVFDDKWNRVIKSVDEPKVKVVHLLLNPDFRGDVSSDQWSSRMDKQEKSIRCWNNIAHRFSHYVQSYSLVNRTVLPVEGCAEPDLVEYRYVHDRQPPMLTYGHYGAYVSHRRALLDEFSEDVDALLIIEGDVVFDVDSEKMVRRIFEGVKFAKSNSGAMVTFGEVKYGISSPASVENTEVLMGDWKKIDHFLCAHCYLVMASERLSIQEKLRSTGWHAWDIWMYWNYDRRVPIYAPLTPLVYEPLGISSIDYVVR